jgi:hypothetical protein
VRAATGLSLIAALAFAVSCLQPGRTVRVEPAVAVDSLHFVIIERVEGVGAPVQGLSVIACGTERSFWTVAADGTRLFPDRVRYGESIPGFPTRTGPYPLSPGCYEVVASGAKPVKFDVQNDGSVRTWRE